MKLFYKKSMLYYFISSLIFFSGCGDEGSSGRRGERGDRHLCEEAGLSEEQKTQVREIHQKNRGSRELSREERRSARERAQKEILEKVPATEEQRKALSECFKRRPGINT